MDNTENNGAFTFPAQENNSAAPNRAQFNCAQEGAGNPSMNYSAANADMSGQYKSNPQNNPYNNPTQNNPYGTPPYYPFSQQPTGPYPYATAAKHNPPSVKTTGIDKVAIAVTAGSLLLLFWSLFTGCYGWVWSFLYPAAIIFMGVYTKIKRGVFEKKAVPVGIAAVILSLTYLLHESDTVSGLALPVLIYLTAVYTVTLSGAAVHSRGSVYYLLDLIHCFIFAPFSEILTPYRSFRKSSKEKKQDKVNVKKSRKNVFFTILGIICGVLVLFIVVPLLLSSAYSFETAVTGIFGNIDEFFEKITELFFDDILAIFIAVFLTVVSFPVVFSSVFASANCRTKEINKDTSAKWKKAGRLPVAFFASLLGVVCAVYVFYTVTQISYLFSAFMGSLPADTELSIAEYAKNGFWELIKIAVINFGLIAASVVLSKKTDEKLSKAIKAFAVFLCIFTMFITVISASKIILYMSTYGLTVKRLLGFAGDIVLFISFVSLLIALFVKKFPYMAVISASACTVIIILALAGTQRTVAYVNYTLYETGRTETIDVAALNQECGTAGFEYLLKLSKEEDVRINTDSYYYYNEDNTVCGADIVSLWMAEKGQAINNELISCYNGSLLYYSGYDTSESDDFNIKNVKYNVWDLQSYRAVALAKENIDYLRTVYENLPDTDSEECDNYFDSFYKQHPEMY